MGRPGHSRAAHLCLTRGGEGKRCFRTHAVNVQSIEGNHVRKLRRILQSQRGDLLVDSMFGALIIAVIMAAAGSVLIAATTASIGNDRTTTLSILLNTVLSDEKPNLAAYTTTPKSFTRTVNEQSISISLWREEPAAGVTVLHAATPRPKATSVDADCSGTDRLDSSKCLTSRIAITTSTAGVAIKAVTLALGTAGAIADFTAPAAATELRYLFKVTTATADSTVTFGNRDHPEVKHVIKVPAGQTGYFYGRLLVNAGSRLFLQSSGPVTIDTASTMIYEAPTP